MLVALQDREQEDYSSHCETFSFLCLPKQIYPISSRMPSLLRFNSCAPTSPTIISGEVGSVFGFFPIQSSAIWFDFSAPARCSKMLIEVSVPPRYSARNRPRILLIPYDRDEAFPYSLQHLLDRLARQQAVPPIDTYIPFAPFLLSRPSR